MVRQYYSPLRYPGGKGKIFSFISSLITENHLVGINYAEPYAGGAGLALRLLCEEYVSNLYINDISPEIYSFWYTVLNDTDRLCNWIEDVEVNVENWKFYKELQKSKDIFELAQSTFFLNRTNVSGVLKGGIIGGINQTGKYKIDARFNKKDLIERIQTIARFRDRIVLSQEDGIEFVKKLNHKRQDFLINIDPPYYEDGKDLYLDFYEDKDHVDLSKQVGKLRKLWILTYDNVDFILNLYKKFYIIKYRLSSGTSNGIGEEVIILPEKIKVEESIKKLNLI